MRCAGLGIETAGLLASGIAEEVEWKFEQTGSGCRSTFNEGNVSRVKDRGDKVGEKGRGCGGVFGGFQGDAVSSCNG